MSTQDTSAAPMTLAEHFTAQVQASEEHAATQSQRDWQAASEAYQVARSEFNRVSYTKGATAFLTARQAYETASKVHEAQQAARADRVAAVVRKEADALLPFLWQEYKEACQLVGHPGHIGDPLEFRVIVHKDRSLSLAVGSPDYDLVHGIGCGAGSLSLDPEEPTETEESTLAAIVDAIEESIGGLF